MAKVRIKDCKDIAWTKIRGAFSGDVLDGIGDAILDSRISLHQLGGIDQPQLTEADYLPGAVIDVHSHTEDEIIYVASGSVIVGSRELKAGSSIFIAANTLYGFAAGQEGVRMAIFRPKGEDHSFSKEEHLARKAAKTLPQTPIVQ